ncbi:MAG: hypothetical protein M1829_002724 [Trizodia sp. TS-e1964]|nr:MAG: hypothetical protein M1829_002724 [Trizodia sp. TS-e1964]
MRLSYPLQTWLFGVWFIALGVFATDPITLQPMFCQGPLEVFYKSEPDPSGCINTNAEYIPFKRRGDDTERFLLSWTCGTFEVGMLGKRAYVLDYSMYYQLESISRCKLAPNRDGDIIFTCTDKDIPCRGKITLGWEPKGPEGRVVYIPDEVSTFDLVGNRLAVSRQGDYSIRCGVRAEARNAQFANA